MDSRDEGMSDHEGQAEEAPQDESLSPKESEDAGNTPNSNESLSMQKRLKQQQRSHERQMRELRSEMQGMREHSSASANPTGGNQPTNPYVPPGVEPGSVEEHVHKAVGYAMNHRDMEERKAKDAESQQHIAKGYQELNNHLDNMSDTHEDFDDVVRGDAPFTSHMRDTALLLPHKGAGSAGEVLYKLGKNRDELKRISRLHPKDQAAEMIRLSHALVGGEEKPRGESHNALGSIKSNPVTNSASITEKTSPGDIRRRMRAGTFK